MNIPKDHILIIEKMLSLPTEAYEELLQVVSKVKEADELEAELGMVAHAELKQISAPELARVIVSMAISAPRQQEELSKFVARLCKAIPLQNEQEAQKRLGALLGAAQGMKNDYELLLVKQGANKFVTEQAMSMELKPIFQGGSVSAAFVYTLQLTYFDNSQKDEGERKIALALDEADIDELARLVETMKKQTQRLKNEFAKTNISIIE